MATNTKNFARALENRTKKFAIDVISLCTKLPSTAESSIIKYQIIKSATSIGANYREANRAVSKADFHHKISICEKEASETQYWLELLEETKIISENHIKDLLRECSELLAIFTTVGRKTVKQSL